MKVLSNLLLVVVVLAGISMHLTQEETDSNSLKFVEDLNKYLSDSDKIAIDNYCSDTKIRCDSNDEITGVILQDLELSGFPTGITIVKDTLKDLDMKNTKLEGNIPNEIYELTKLEHLRLEENNFDGSLSDNIKNLDKLRVLNLTGSSLSGEIPDGLYSMTELRVLSLRGNKFNGGLKDDIKNLAKLRNLDLADLSLSGSIPDGIYALNDLTHIHLQGNEFSGSLSNDIENLNNLKTLDLSGNKDISGSIPDGLYALVGLEYLDLMDNNISGSLSSKIGDMTMLTELNLGSNRLSGAIPNEIGKLNNLKALEMRENEFEGDIPDLSGLTGLEHMNISSTKHSLNAKCDDKMLPPSIQKENCLVRPVSKLCDNVTHCEYSDKPIPKSSVGSIFYTYGLKTIVMMVVCRGAVGMILN
ncbi:uncharacterized protein LOC126325531 [Schistocerca gregaria]|uniref:uncharacterized protein LOC126325531 n=1 Tax=Schistocerca gregaria TaxID=7010 RepID=UPI00211E7A06|nr:uncharacterized protein LOC126325531 [Schistocerca gregaria]